MVTEGKLQGLNKLAEWKKSRGTPSPWTTRKFSLLDMEHEATIELHMIDTNMPLLPAQEEMEILRIILHLDRQERTLYDHRRQASSY